MDETTFTNLVNVTPITLAPSDTRLVVSGLQPYTYYNVIISTVLTDKVFFTQSFMYNTRSAAPPTPPTNIGLQQALPNTVFIYFTPANTTGDGLYFAIDQTDMVSNTTISFHGIIGQNVGPTANVRVPSLICESNLMILFASALMPNTPYVYRFAQATLDGVVSFMHIILYIR